MAKTSEAQMRAKDKYERANIRQVMVKFNRKTEPELTAWIEGKESMQGYILELVRADMERRSKESD